VILMVDFKPIEGGFVLSGIISKEVFNALAQGKTREEDFDEIDFFNEDDPDIRYEGRENFINVEIFPSDNQNLKEIGPSEIFLSKIDLKGIKRGALDPNPLEIFTLDTVNQFGKYAKKQFLKIKIISKESERE